MNLSTASLKLSLPRISYGPRISPVRDWVVLLVVSLLVVAAFAVAAAWQYLAGAHADALSTIPAIPETVSPAVLAETEELFAHRAAEALRYQSEYRFVDPSL